MYGNLQEVFDKYLEVKPDQNLYETMKAFRISWAQKNDEHIDYLGDSLIGCYRIIFSTQDEDVFYGILGLDKIHIQKELWNVKGIFKEMKVVSNGFYLTCVYLMHMYTNNTAISNKLREDAVREIFYIMSYKMLSSLNTWFFKYPVDISIAKAVNERMTLKFLVKRYGNWQSVIAYKAEDVLPKGIHEDRIADMKRAEDATRVISDIQTKYRDMYKNHYSVLIKVQEQNERINSSTLIVEHEDNVGIKDITNRPDLYVEYVKSIVEYPQSFVNVDLCLVISSLFKAFKDNQLIEFVNWFSAEKIKDKEWYIEKSIVNCLGYLTTKKITSDFIPRMYEIMVILKSYYLSSNIRNDDIKKMKKDLQKMTNSALKRCNTAARTNLGIALIIYIFLRSLYK